MLSTRRPGWAKWSGMERPPLAGMLVGAAGASGGQGDIGRMFADLIDAHDRRMAALGL